MESVIVIKRVAKNIVSVRCPYCMEGHFHRERVEGEMLGMRRASCGRGFYVIQERPARQKRTEAPRKDR